MKYPAYNRGVQILSLITTISHTQFEYYKIYYKKKPEQQKWLEHFIAGKRHRDSECLAKS